jgi:hypothetical protein
MALTPEGTPYVESTDLVANYPAASLSLANRVDLVGVLPFATSAARATAIPTPTDGQFTYLQDTNSTEFYNGTAFEALGGKLLQVVRATDATSRSTSSTSYVDASLSVTITPKKSTSVLYLFHTAELFGGSTDTAFTQITDSSNVALSGAEATGVYTGGQRRIGKTVIGYVAPGTTSAVTYKVRFRTDNAATTAQLLNAQCTGQLIAIEVGA